MNDPSAETCPESHVALTRLQAWRTSGASDVDPVRFRWIEAMARRAAQHSGAARQWLDKRLQQLLDDYAQRIARASEQAVAAAGAPIAAAPEPLVALREYIARHGGAAGDTRNDAAAPSGTRASAAGPAELKTLSRFRSTWVRLSARQRLAQVRAQVPDNAGPLNTQQLVHRSLCLMQAQSSGYLEHFMVHLDALLLLEQALEPPLPAAAATRADGTRKPPRVR